MSEMAVGPGCILAAERAPRGKRREQICERKWRAVEGGGKGTQSFGRAPRRTGRISVFVPCAVNPEGFFHFPTEKTRLTGFGRHHTLSVLLILNTI